MRDRPAPRPLRLLSMGSHPCLPRPSVYGSLEQTALSMKLVLDVCFLVEKVSLRVFVTVSTLSRFLSDAIDGSSLAHPLFSTPFDLLSGRRDLFRCFSAHLLFISLRIPWALNVPGCAKPCAIDILQGCVASSSWSKTMCFL